jgi:predicted ATP-grasp superfamily ATP-dependent carboligase
MAHRAPIVLIDEYVTGGGLAGQDRPACWAAEGSAMRKTFAAQFAAVKGLRVIATLDRGLSELSAPWSNVLVGPGEELSTLTRLASEAAWTLIIAPETAGILQDRTGAVERVGARVLGSASGAIAITANKLYMGLHLEERGIPTPPSRIVNPAAGLPAQATYPAVLKPIDGAGSLNTFYVERLDDLPPAAKAMNQALLQPFLPGEPMSASFLIDVGGRPWLLGVGRQQITVTGGAFAYCGGTLPVRPPPGFAAVEAAVASVPGLRGFVGVDFLWDEHSKRLWVLDVNPRPTTSCVGLSALLPPGWLARSWLEAMEWCSTGLLRRLASRVQSNPAVCFDASGNVRAAISGGAFSP